MSKKVTYKGKSYVFTWLLFENMFSNRKRVKTSKMIYRWNMFSIKKPCKNVRNDLYRWNRLIIMVIMGIIGQAVEIA